MCIFRTEDGVHMALQPMIRLSGFLSVLEKHTVCIFRAEDGVHMALQPIRGEDEGSMFL
jgi:hypothetical protein